MKFGKNSDIFYIQEEDPLVEKFLNEARKKYQKLSIEDEIEYFERINAGDKRAAEEFIGKNLLFAFSIAKQYQKKGLSLSDLIQEASIGLTKSIENFDPTRGFKFSSHAVWWIRSAILDSLYENSRIVRLPRNKVDSMNKVKKTIQLFEKEHGFSPSEEEISEIMDISPDDIFYRDDSFIYLDQTLESGTFCSEEFGDPEEDFDNRISDFDKEILKEEISKIIESSMSPREKIFIKESFLNPFIVEPNDDILADAMGVTNTAARQMRRRVFEKMKKRIIQSPVIMGLGIIN